MTPLGMLTEGPERPQILQKGPVLREHEAAKRFNAVVGGVPT